MEKYYGLKDVNLIIYDDKGEVFENEIIMKNHKEFSMLTKILMRNGITFEIVSYNRMHEEMEKAGAYSE